MGVHGLWRLLDASGKPVPLETLEGKVLAIDVSIWIHQVLQGYQDRRGSVVPNAHLLGLFHRICKLLYFKIRPIFVFDGGVPLLKKNTIASRKKQKAIAAVKANQMKHDLIQNLIKHTAVKGVLAAAAGVAEKSATSSQETSSSSSSKTANSVHDMFKLPSLPAGSQQEESIDDYEDYDSDSSIELSPRKQSRWVGNIHSVDVTSADFKALPADVRYDVLNDLKETRKQNSWGRLHEMPDKSNEFSDYQMKRLLKRRQVQESLETAEKEMGGKTLTLEELEILLSEQGIETNRQDTAFRIASDSTTRVIFIKDPKTLRSAASDDNSNSEQTSTSTSQLSEVHVSRDSGNEDLSFVTNSAESVIENINEYDLDDSDWESEDEAMMPVKSVEPSPMLTKKYFGKQRINPALAYMLEYAGIPQDEILALMQGNKKKSTTTSKDESNLKEIEETTEFINLVSPENETAENKDKKKIEACSSKLFSDSEDLIEVPEEVADSKTLKKSNADLEVIQNRSRGLDETGNNSISSVKLMSSDSDTDSDLVEIPDVPVPEPNFGLQITVNSEQCLKDEDDIFADVFASESAEISNVSTQDISSSRDSSANFSFQEINETSPAKKTGVTSHTPNPRETEVVANISIGEKTDDSTLTEKAISVNKDSNIQIESSQADKTIEELPNLKPDEDSIAMPSFSRADELSEQVAKFKPELLKANQEKLVSMEAELESEHSDLTENIGKLERQATAVTDQMRMEAQDLLRLFGIPYIVAPMEAEAQCAYLENIKLTDGTITDDSDIWLFGGRCVYKNFFNNNKRVMEYKSSDIEHHFKLTRQQMIQLALLVGSDYTVGVTGIGPVTALEILAAFPAQGDNLLHGLTSFGSWIKTGRSAGPGRTALRTKLRNVEIERGFPSQAVVQAYLFPTVDESKESFTWSKPNLTLLADYTRQKFGWTRLKFEETISPVVKKLAECKSQKGIGAYFKVSTVPKSIETTLSKRVKKAVQRLANGSAEADSNDEEKDDEDDVNEPEISGQGTKGTKKRRVKGLKKQSVETRLEAVAEEGEEAKTVDAMSVGSEMLDSNLGQAAKGNVPGTSAVKRNGKNVDEYIPQREKDKANALKKKLRAIEVFRKSKKGPGRTKKAKRAICNITKEAELSESSDDDSK